MFNGYKLVGPYAVTPKIMRGPRPGDAMEADHALLVGDAVDEDVAVPSVGVEHSTKEWEGWRLSYRRERCTLACTNARLPGGGVSIFRRARRDAFAVIARRSGASYAKVAALPKRQRSKAAIGV